MSFPSSALRLGVLASSLLASFASSDIALAETNGYSARITAARPAAGKFEVLFEVTGNPPIVQLTAATNLAQEFWPAASAEISRVSDRETRALIPMPSSAQFFRIRLLSETQTNQSHLPAEGEVTFGPGRGFNGFSYIFQQVYPASEFRNILTKQISIRGLRFRLQEGSRSLNAFFPKVTLEMATITNTLSTLPENQFISPKSAQLVFSRENIQLSAPLGSDPSTFSVAFTLDQPFVYTPNNGHLWLMAWVMSNDANTSLDVFRYVPTDKYGRGWFVSDRSDRRVAESGMLATEFSYTAVSEEAFTPSKQAD